MVVLHGCTQTAAGYDAGSGWSTLADEQGFLLLFPEQQRANNPNLCFNWFSQGDIRRGEGEALSICQMIATLVRDHDADPARVFITGLSAGGAMTSVMLATYPEVFAGGAIIAGLPYGTAKGVPQALERMTGQGMPNEQALGGLVRKASSHAGPWPTLSVWHGSSDPTVNAINAEAILAQWRSVQGLTNASLSSDTVDGFPHHSWRDANNCAVLEYHDITGMAHGTPLHSKERNPCGVPGPYFLDVGISSTRRIAAFWGLTNEREARDVPPTRPVIPAERPQPRRSNLPIVRTLRAERIYEATPKPAATTGVGKIIEDALRAAGLMK
ncbi:poly(hydroxyalkanoate) depolymerase family esterase [Sphingomonas vulcanisoli]|uniref:Poly(Hydroxyalkanoate) depolymerase family esterase n=1 Tax=Sphingomonas vulcanisoli TaxID=1658060 RepID=A0ABX0TS08_9SPHN|nr:poly(hydroxyalkanoate) depolymerase family esterase [Sphingomonas vulcanisoli]